MYLYQKDNKNIHAFQWGINALSYINLMEYYAAIKIDGVGIYLLMQKDGQALEFRFFFK